MDYGFSFFLQMLSIHNSEVLEKQRRIAVAVRCAQNMTQKEWNKYMRRRL